jgi:CRISPR-associated exonuclease Cas4
MLLAPVSTELWRYDGPSKRPDYPSRRKPARISSSGSSHWALGQVTPPTLKGALQGENREKRDESHALQI